MHVSQTTAFPLPAALSSAEVQSTAPTRRVSFNVRAHADPGALPRVLELFAKRGLTPELLQSAMLEDGVTLDISVEVAGLMPTEANHVANCLRTLPAVTNVLAMDVTQI
ncbi:MAG TPA: hypothetical protein VD978_16635 [Azospirillum sp.]|nr:hypothetical protein [Azospirillum sp.]